MFKSNNNLWSFNVAFLIIIFLAIIVNNGNNLINAQTVTVPTTTTPDTTANLDSNEETETTLKNLRPAYFDDGDRNIEKLLIIFNGTCAPDMETVTEIVVDMQISYECLILWISEANPSQNGIYPQANGNHHVYFDIKDPYNETICIDNILIDYDSNCIQIVDYELKLYHQQCKNNGVYDYPDTTDYRWHRDAIDGVIDNNYTHLDTSSEDTVDVYVLDTGIYHTHYEFSQVQYTLLDPTYDISSVVAGHGTHVAGIIVGRTVGITSHSLFDYPVCRGETAVCYSSYMDDAFNIILTRAQTTKRRGVINMSFGSSLLSSPAYYLSSVDSQMSTLVANGIIPIAAGGNSGQDSCKSWPASSSNTIGVGAHDSSYSVPSWSNYGSCIDIYSPGVNVLSSWIGSDYTYRYASGTSMAAPVVSGLVADMLWNDKSITYDQIIAKLQSSSKNVVLSSCPAASSTVCSAVRADCSSWYDKPTSSPTMKPTTTSSPTMKPTTTSSPTMKPTTTSSPTMKPTTTSSPTMKPTTTSSPTMKPTTTSSPTMRPTTTSSPTMRPTTTSSPTGKPTTRSPTQKPTEKPTTTSPTQKPTSKAPTTTTKTPTSSNCRASQVSCTTYTECCSKSCIRRTCQ